jgi:hypothetical protein
MLKKRYKDFGRSDLKMVLKSIKRVCSLLSGRLINDPSNNLSPININHQMSAIHVNRADALASWSAK